MNGARGGCKDNATIPVFVTHILGYISSDIYFHCGWASREKGKRKGGCGEGFE